MTRIGVLASGRGSNFRALCEAGRHGVLGSGTFAVLVSDRADAGALATAREFGVEALAILPRTFPSREAHESAVADALAARRVDLVCLAGYMRLLTAGFLLRFPRRVLNVHPALLPSFPGLHGQRQALEYGARITGATVHFVDEGCDTGPVILQAAVAVEDGDTEESLSARILEEEHRIYPEAVRLFCAGRLKIDGRRVHILEREETPA
ncbi:MAG: phosphoribosylglycinamide formyltransferase [Candidatus Coatesbacteria bacterium]